MNEKYKLILNEKQLTDIIMAVTYHSLNLKEAISKKTNRSNIKDNFITDFKRYSELNKYLDEIYKNNKIEVE